MELAFQSIAYTGSEQPSLRDAMICVEIIMGILERDVVVDVIVINGTAESMFVIVLHTKHILSP